LSIIEQTMAIQYCFTNNNHSATSLTVHHYRRNVATDTMGVLIVFTCFPKIQKIKLTNALKLSNEKHIFLNFNTAIIPHSHNSTHLFVAD